MIIVPSRQRPGQLIKFFESYRTSKSTEPGLIIIGWTDWCNSKRIYEEIAIPSNWDFDVSEHESMGDKIRHIWPRFVKEKWPNFILLNDDHRMITLEWDKILIAQLKGWNFVTCNDMFQPTRAGGATVWSRELLLAVGYIFLAHMKHLFIDSVWEDLGREAECWVNDQSVIVQHVHAFRTGVQDETHRLAYMNWAHDEILYNTWRVKEKPNAVARILALRKSLSNS